MHKNAHPRVIVAPLHLRISPWRRRSAVAELTQANLYLSMILKLSSNNCAAIDWIEIRLFEF